MIGTRIVKSNCKRLAKCGMRSVRWCRTFRDTCEECRDCTLIHRIQRSNMMTVDGVELRRCGHCGRFLPLSRYYRKNIRQHAKVYHTYSSWCAFCISRSNYERRKARIMAEK